jgi:hypothetical protein
VILAWFQGCQAEGTRFAPQTKKFCLYSSHVVCSRMNPESMGNGCRDTTKTLFDPFSIQNKGTLRTSRWEPMSISPDLDLALQSEIADILQVNKVWKKVMESLGGKFAKRFLQTVTDQNLETNILGDPHVNARKICTNCHHQSCHRTHIKYLHDMCIHPLPCYYPLAFEYHRVNGEDKSLF